MIQSRIKTVTLPATRTAGNQALIIARAGMCPLRILVRVRAAPGLEAVLSYEPAGLMEIESDGAVSGGFTIPQGESESLVLAPGQTLWAAGTAAGVKICVAISEASDADASP